MASCWTRRSLEATCIGSVGDALALHCVEVTRYVVRQGERSDEKKIRREENDTY